MKLASKLSGAMFLGLLTLAPVSYADNHKCTCDKKCAEACEKGQGAETCKCEVCNCKHTGKCKHGKDGTCEHEKAAGKADPKVEPKK